MGTLNDRWSGTDGTDCRSPGVAAETAVAAGVWAKGGSGRGAEMTLWQPGRLGTIPDLPRRRVRVAGPPGSSVATCGAKDEQLDQIRSLAGSHLVCHRR